MSQEQIRPALSREQWARLHDSHGIPVEIAAVLAVENNDWHGGMALCNHVLPDEDPRRITRADVETLTVTVDAMDRAYVAYLPARDNLLTLIAKLSALLPPAE
jgi:hypothetical protein